MDLLIETPHRHGCLEVQGSAQEWWWQSSSHTALHLSCVHLTLITNDDGHQQLGRWLDPLEVRVAPPCQGICCLCSQLDIFRAWVCSIGLGTSAMVLGKNPRSWNPVLAESNGLLRWLGQPPAGPQMVSKPHGLAMGLENIHNWFILGGVDISSAGMASTQAWDGYIGPQKPSERTPPTSP